MGEIIVRKVRGMNWKAKISLVLIFTLAFSTFMYQGWYKPKMSEATGTTNGRIVYSSNTTTPQNSAYTASSNTFAAGGATVAGAIPTFMVNRSSKARNENIAGYVTTGGVLYIMRYNGTSWTSEWNVTVGGNGVNGRRFDIAYEQSSGKAMVVYSRNVTGSAGNEMAYRIWDGAAWTTAANINSARLTQTATNNAVSSIKLAARPASNEIALLACDNGTTTGNNATLTSFIWNGAAWGNEPATAHDTAITVSTGMLLQYDNFDLAYEGQSGELMVVWFRQAATYLGGYRTYSAGTWSAVTTMPGTNARNIQQAYAVANPRTNQVMVIAVRSGTTAGIYGYIWDGTSWVIGQTSIGITMTATASPNKKWITGQWLNVGGTDYGVAIAVTSTAGTIGYNSFSGSAWGTAATYTSGTGTAHQWLDSDVDPNVPDTLILTFSDSANDVFARRLVLTAGPTFTFSTPTGGTVGTALTNITTQNFDFEYNRLDVTPPVTSSVTFDSPVYSTFVGSPFTFHGTLTDNESAVSSCQVCVKNGAECTSADTWVAGTISGSGPAYTCTATDVSTYSNGGAISSGNVVYVDVRGTSIGGQNVDGGTSATKTMDKTPPSEMTSFTVTAGTDQNSLSWASPGTDANSGFAGYKVVYLPGATAPADCNSGTTAYAGTGTTYTHSVTPTASTISYRVCAVDNVNIPSAGRTASGAPTWSYSIASCGRCHAYPPLDSATRDAATGAFVGSHQAGGHQVACSTCHVAPATQTSADFAHRDGNITMQASISGGSYSKASPIAQTNNPTTGTCSNISCHGANNPTPQWGVGTVGCVDCHSAQITRTKGVPGGTLSQITGVGGEFGLAWGHKKTGRGTVTDADCIVCHLEGNYSTQRTSGYHADGNIDLRDPDGAGETPITNNTGGAFTFTKFSLDLTTQRTSAITNGIADVITQKFCIACHDSNGATNPTARSNNGGTGTQYMPFGGISLGAAYTPANGQANGAGAPASGGLIDVKTQFATSNSSYHPVLGPLLRDFPTAALVAAPYKPTGSRGTSGTKSNSVILNCFDCHNTPTTPLTTRTVAAHGNAVTLRGNIYVSPTTFCQTCHITYTATDQHPTGSGETDRLDGGENMGTSCYNCHGSSGNDVDSIAVTTQRPVRAQDYHGYNSLVGGGLWPTVNGRPYGFIRNINSYVYHRPFRSTEFTTGSAQCSGGTNQCANNNQAGPRSYLPGGSY